MPDLPKPAANPCGSCPYRKDVPSGIWAEEEYEKLPLYDGQTWEQHTALFMCHQRDGCLCAGWLACHDINNLLALRINRVDPSVFDYKTKIPVFESGAAAAEHGMAEIDRPGIAANKLMTKLQQQRIIQNA